MFHLFNCQSRLCVLIVLAMMSCHGYGAPVIEVGGNIVSQRFPNLAITRIADDEQNIFQSQIAGDTTFTIKDLAPGKYSIRLEVAELETSKHGERLFDIFCNDNAITQNLDLAKTFGFGVRAAVEVPISLEKSQEKVEIRLRGIRGKPIWSTFAILNDKGNVTTSQRAVDLKGVRSVTQGNSSPLERLASIESVMSKAPKGMGIPIADRSAWERALQGFDAAPILIRAEQYLAQPTPDLPGDLYFDYKRTGNRIRFEDPYARRADRVSYFALAECITNSGKFIPAVEKEINAILDEPTWVLPAHSLNGPASDEARRMKDVDLGGAMRAWILATSDWLLGDRLSSETRKRLREEIQKRIFSPFWARYKRNENYCGWVKGTNNWNAVCTAGVVATALTLIEAPRERAEYVVAAEQYLKSYLQGFADDGYCSEGIGYWMFGYGHYILLAEEVLISTEGNVDFYSPAIVRKLAHFQDRFALMPGIFPAFGDAVVGTGPHPALSQVIDNHFYGESSSAEKRRVVMDHPIGAMIYLAAAQLFPSKFREPNSLHPDFEDSLRNYFDKSGVLICRPVQNSDHALAVAIKGGHNDEPHNHNDLGSFTVAVDNACPILDVGREIYTARTFGPNRYDSNILNSYGHPVPLVAGKLQLTGAQAQAKILSEHFTTDKDVLVMDLTSAYPVPELVKLTRTFVYSRNPKNCLEVIDDVEFKEKSAFGGALMTLGKWKSLSKNSLLVFSGDSCVKVDVQSQDGQILFNPEELKENLDKNKKAIRLGFALKEPVIKATIRYSIEWNHPPSSLNEVIPLTADDLSIDLSQSICLDAGSFSTQSAGQAEITQKVGAEGHAIRLWDNDGHAISWSFKIPADGYFAVLVRYCGDTKAERAVLIDGMPLDGIDGGFVFPSTGGWSSQNNDWKASWLAQNGRRYRLFLTSGNHVITFVNVGGTPVNFDWIKLVPLTAK